MKKLPLLLTALLAFPTLAKPVKNEKEAFALVQKSIIKNQLATQKMECLMLVNMPTTADLPYYEIEVREKHNEKCGGDPTITTRLFTFSVHKGKGWLKTDAIAMEGFEDRLLPIDPISPIIRYDYDEKGKKVGETPLPTYVKSTGKIIEPITKTHRKKKKSVDNSVINAKGKRLVTPETVKLYQANYNTWLMCVYPRLWKLKLISNDAFHNQLDKFADSTDTEEKWISSSYIQGMYQLNEDYFGDEPNYDELLIGGALSDKFFDLYAQLSQKEKNATLVKDCNQDWGAIREKRRTKLGLKN